MPITQRAEMGMLVKEILWGQTGVIWLTGPIGSGKTYLVKALPSALQHAEGIQSTFFLYLRRQDFDWGKCQDTERNEAQACFIHVLPAQQSPHISEWASLGECWSKIRKPIQLEEFGSDIVSNPKRWIDLITALRDRYKCLVVLLDGYDQWPADSLRDTYDVMAEMLNSEAQTASTDMKLVFVIASEQPPSYLRQKVDRETVLFRAVPVQTRLLANDNVRLMLDQESEAVPEGLIDQWHTDDTLREVCSITGRYPVVTTGFLNALSTECADKPQAAWNELVRMAQQKVGFQSVLSCLYHALPRQSQQALALLALSIQIGRAVFEVRTDWENRRGEHFLTQDQFRRELLVLERDRLLVESRDGDWRILGSAFQEYVLRQEHTQALRYELGLRQSAPVKRTGARLVLGLSILGLVLYIILATFRPLLDSLKIPDITRQILTNILAILPFLPALIVFVVRFWRHSRE